MSLVARWQAHSDRDRLAVAVDGSSLTYGELWERVRRGRRVLRERGVAPGDVVAVMMPRTPEFLVFVLACLSEGAVVLPLNERYTQPEVAFILGDAAPVLAVLSTQHHDASGWLSPDACGELLRQAAPLNGGQEPKGDAPAMLLYTSGTTGKPKGALHTHDSLGATVDALHAAWRWSADDVLLHALPLTHVHGLVVAQFGALRAGAATHWVDRFDAAGVAQRLERGDYTVFMGVPTFYNRIVDLPSTHSFDHVRLFTSGSAPLSIETHERFRDRFGHAILERYGMTEVGIVFSNPYDERVPGSIGRPLPHVCARIVDPDTHRDVLDGEAGELWVRGPSLFTGYRGLPEQTRAAVVDGWMRTGDLARRDDRGFVVLLGRRGDMILRGGFNVYPAEVEAVLRSHAHVHDAAVVGLDDPDLGQVVGAAVVGECDLEEVVGFARTQLAPYKVPSTIIAMEQLPRNTMGKVLKRELRGMLADRQGRSR